MQDDNARAQKSEPHETAESTGRRDDDRVSKADATEASSDRPRDTADENAGGCSHPDLPTEESATEADNGGDAPVVFHAPGPDASPLWCPDCVEGVTRETEPIPEEELGNFHHIKCIKCNEVLYVDDDQDLPEFEELTTERVATKAAHLEDQVQRLKSTISILKSVNGVERAVDEVGDLFNTATCDTDDDWEYLLALVGEAAREGIDDPTERAVWVVDRWCEELHHEPENPYGDAGEFVPDGGVDLESCVFQRPTPTGDYHIFNTDESERSLCTAVWLESDVKTLDVWGPDVDEYEPEEDCKRCFEIAGLLDGSVATDGGEVLDFATHVGDKIHDDEMYDTLQDVDFNLSDVDSLDSDFGSEIDDHVSDALHHIRRAIHLREAELSHAAVRTEGHRFSSSTDAEDQGAETSPATDGGQDVSSEWTLECMDCDWMDSATGTSHPAEGPPEEVEKKVRLHKNTTDESHIVRVEGTHVADNQDVDPSLLTDGGELVDAASDSGVDPRDSDTSPNPATAHPDDLLGELVEIAYDSGGSQRGLIKKVVCRADEPRWIYIERPNGSGPVFPAKVGRESIRFLGGDSA